MSVIMTYLLRFLCLCNYKIGYGSAWSNWKQEFYLPLRAVCRLTRRHSDE